MQREKYSLKTITPNFCSGSDGRKAEIRPSSIKGSLRYWFRAVVAEKNLKKLHKRENEIFGSTDEASSFAIKIPNIREVNNKKNINSVRPVPVIDENKRPKKKFRSEAVKKDVNIDVEIILYNSELKKEIKSTFDIFLMLGSFGQRSRRGFGSIQRRGNKYSNKKDFLHELKEKLEILNDSEITVENNTLKINNKNDPEYPYIKEVSIGSNNNFTRKELLTQISEATHDNKDKELGSIKPRMASPVYVTIKEINDKFYPVITELNAVYPNNKYNNFEDSDKKICDFIEDLRDLNYGT